jgi:hypothetical protein
MAGVGGMVRGVRPRVDKQEGRFGGVWRRLNARAEQRASDAGPELVERRWPGCVPDAREGSDERRVRRPMAPKTMHALRRFFLRSGSSSATSLSQ